MILLLCCAVQFLTEFIFALNAIKISIRESVLVVSLCVSFPSLLSTLSALFFFLSLLLYTINRGNGSKASYIKFLLIASSLVYFIPAFIPFISTIFNIPVYQLISSDYAIGASSSNDIIIEGSASPYNVKVGGKIIAVAPSTNVKALPIYPILSLDPSSLIDSLSATFSLPLYIALTTNFRKKLEDLMKKYPFPRFRKK